MTDRIRICLLAALICAFCCSGCVNQKPRVSAAQAQAFPNEPRTLDLREPMELAARTIPPRLDPNLDFRPWFLLRGSNGIPTTPEHSTWDVGDMTGGYLESLIRTRWMGVGRPEFSDAEWRLSQQLFRTLGSDGLVHDPDSGATVHPFSQGSALYGLLTWFEDTHDPKVRAAMERLISGLLQRAGKHGDQLRDASARLPQCSGSHLAGYQIFPIVRFYELTGYPDALQYAEGLTRWAIADPILDGGGEDVGTVEGCCLNGGMRAITLAWLIHSMKWTAVCEINCCKISFAI